MGEQKYDQGMTARVAHVDSRTLVCRYFGPQRTGEVDYHYDPHAQSEGEMHIPVETIGDVEADVHLHGIVAMLALPWVETVTLQNQAGTASQTWSYED